MQRQFVRRCIAGGIGKSISKGPTSPHFRHHPHLHQETFASAFSSRRLYPAHCTHIYHSHHHHLPLRDLPLREDSHSLLCHILTMMSLSTSHEQISADCITSSSTQSNATALKSFSGSPKDTRHTHNYTVEPQMACLAHNAPQCCHCGYRGAHAPNCPFR